ncbi:hypothetical protein NK718_19470 [Alsobacter sp. SYSU M60028]|uniref:Uncharacterized protein n=1 Tax=Alsobacter ponti TaxID=2962936 RepID=A0ABT1LGS9_9HYPH|nr:hypothetical protein [Alsobacter ponti]MCP8940711.1 hypothetical protein [Alsobacter ponti]
MAPKLTGEPIRRGPAYRRALMAALLAIPLLTGMLPQSQVARGLAQSEPATDRYEITSGPFGASGPIWLMFDRQTGRSWQLVCGAGAPNLPSPPPGGCALEWQPVTHSARTPPARTPP